MKKSFASAVVLLLVFCMLLPMTVSAANVYDISASITDTGSAAGDSEGHTVSDSLTMQSGSAKMVEVLAQIVFANYESMRAFRSPAMKEIMDEGLAIAGTVGTHLTDAWSAYADMILTGDAAAISRLRVYDTTIDEYGAGTYTVSLQNRDTEDAKYLVTYTVTFTITRHGASSYVVIPVSTDENDFALEVTVEIGEDMAQVVVEQEEIQAVIDSSEENDTPTYVTVNLSCLEDDISAVGISTDALSQIAVAAMDEDSNIAGLEITMPDSMVAAFDGLALSAVVEQADGEEIVLVITMYEVAAETLNETQQEAIAEFEEPVVIEAYFMCNGVRIGNFKGGTARMTCTYPSENPAHVYYLKETGELEALSSYYDSVKKEVVFIAEHFSHFVITSYDVNGYLKCRQDETCVYAPFTDIDPKAWYHHGVHFCVENFLMIGTGEQIFSPNAKTTRGQIVTILYRMSGLPAVGKACPFEDVAEGSYYEDAIAWAAENGVVEGYSDVKFGPDDPITREQLAKILYFYETKFKGNPRWTIGDELSFTDSAMVHDWAYESMCWATDVGILEGVKEGVLDPQGNAIRAQAACMIQRYCTLG